MNAPQIIPRDLPTRRRLEPHSEEAYARAMLAQAKREGQAARMPSVGANSAAENGKRGGRPSATKAWPTKGPQLFGDYLRDRAEPVRTDEIMARFEISQWVALNVLGIMKKRGAVRYDCGSRGWVLVEGE